MQGGDGVFFVHTPFTAPPSTGHFLAKDLVQFAQPFLGCLSSDAYIVTGMNLR